MEPFVDCPVSILDIIYHFSANSQVQTLVLHENLNFLPFSHSFPQSLNYPSNFLANQLLSLPPVTKRVRKQGPLFLEFNNKIKLGDQLI
jgi:hypothetical protein